MLLDLKFSIGTLGIGSGAFVAALYGMNLKNFMEESSLGFLGVTGWCLVFAGIVCGYGLTKLRKVQRVTMFAESGAKGRDWITDDTGLQLGRREREMRHRRLKAERHGALEETRMNLLQQRQDAAVAASAALVKRGV
jgi:magnesium transporter